VLFFPFLFFQFFFMQLPTGYNVFHASQNFSHGPGIASSDALLVPLTVRVPKQHMMLSSSTSVESEFDLVNLAGTTETATTTTMPWPKSSPKEDTGPCSISEQPQPSVVINALPGAGLTTEAGALLPKSEPEDKAMPDKMIPEAIPKSQFVRHQEERKKREIKRTLNNNRQPPQQAIKQAEAVKVEVETRLKQASHELKQSINQHKICKLSTELCIPRYIYIRHFVLSFLCFTKSII
jgi:hypothetical protein